MSPATIPASVARQLFRWCLAGALLLAAQVQAAPPAPPAGFAAKTAQVNGTTIYYRIGGKGPPVVLLHGYTQTGHMWTPLMAQLAKNHTVIVADLRGTGASAKPPDGYEKANMARDIHALVKGVTDEPATVVGHDIGMMVAYAYAAQYPADTKKVGLMDAFLPGIGNWQDMFLLRDLWHFHFFGETPERLVQGRERIYFEHFWNDFAADPKRSIPEADRKLYAATYAQPGGVHAGFEYFKAFPRDAEQFAALGKTRLTMPVLVLAGEKSGGDFLVNQVKLVADQVDGKVVKGSGHWLMEEARDETIRTLLAFID